MELRELKDLTQAELGKLADIPAAAISHFETGFRFPGSETLTKLAEALGVSVDYLLGAEGPHPRIQAIFRDAPDLSDESLKQLEEFTKILKDVDAKRRPKG